MHLWKRPLNHLLGSFLKYMAHFHPWALQLPLLSLMYYVKNLHCRLNDTQCESWELSFTWDKMRTVAEETAPQITLRDCSKKAMAEGQYIRFWWRRSSMQSDSLLQHRVQSLKRQMANALVVVQLLANALGKCQFVADSINF